MIDCLSIAEIRRWCESKFSKGTVSPHLLRGRELPTLAFCRAVGIDDGWFSKFRTGNYQLNPHEQRMFSRFIRDWENGVLEFETVRAGPKGNHGRKLVRRETPKPRPPRFTVDLTASPRLRILPRPALNVRLPTMKSGSPTLEPPP